MTGEYINVAHPEWTQEDADDIETSKRCAYLIHTLRMRLTTRYDVEQELEAMPEEKMERAKYWLNYYR